MSTDKDVVIVAAGSAYALYVKYAMYFCQPGRSFQPIERLGFYTGNEIKPHVPGVLARRDAVHMSRASAHTLRLSSSHEDVAIGQLMEHLLADGVLCEGDVQQVFLLSPADDPRTLVLPAPIRNGSVGPRGQRVAWTQRQRYISSAALKAAPETTVDLTGVAVPATEPGVAGDSESSICSGTTPLSLPQGHGLVGQTPWYQEIRDIHDRHFHDPWQERVDVINQRYRLSRQHMLFTPDPDGPFPWFNGDIEAVEPERWILVISLNHFVNPDAREAYDRSTSARYTPETYWDHRRTFNTQSWYRHFFGPLARVGAAALGEQLTREQEPTFATNRMIFVEMCPYGSQKFSLSWQTVEELLVTDLGFRLASDVNRLLIERGRPALVMVNGLRAIDMFEHVYADALTWRQVRYASCDLRKESGMPKRLMHYCGSLELGHYVVPVVGFPFLRTPATHNSNSEVALLARYVRQCVEDQRCHVSSKDRSAGAKHQERTQASHG